MDRLNQISKWILSAFGGGVLIYCLIVLAFVATCPDIQLRILLTGSNPKTIESPNGVEIQKTLFTPGSEIDPSDGSQPTEYYGEKPAVGDILVEVGNRKTPSFPDFTRSLVDLRSRRETATLQMGDDPSEELEDSVGSVLVFVDKQGNVVDRAVRIKFWREGWKEPRTAFIVIKPMPYGPVALSLVWFVLQMGVFFVAGFAYWNRPFERSARLFFLMSTVTLGAFIGGFHWWIIAGSLLLNLPFVLCAVFLPAVALHFFLIYPEPKQFLSRFGQVAVIINYAIPVFGAISICASVAYTSWFVGNSDSEVIASVAASMVALRSTIDIALLVASIYFIGSLCSLLHSVIRPLNPIEKSQVQWILWAGIFAVVPVTYTVYLAFFNRVEFALGSSRVPMFFASLVFLFAYAVGIVRYRLMLVDQMVSRGMLYYVFGYGSTFVYSFIIAVGSLFAASQGISLPNRAVPVTVILILSIIVLMWLRDRIKTFVEKRFFSEKYKLDQALSEMNVAVGDLVNRRLLASRMLSSCKEVLRIDQAGLYLQSGEENSFQLVTSLRKGNLPKEYRAHPEFLDALRQGPSLQRTNVGSRGQMTAVQKSIRELDAHLVHALELENNIAGLVVIGSKQKNAPFTAEDVTFLHALGQITGVALHCAKVQQDVKHLNEDLQDKVGKIQDQRRQIAVLQQRLSVDTVEEITPVAAKRVPFEQKGIVGSSLAIQNVMETVSKVAPSESSVLVRGESGTGKELLAKSIHENSTRKNGPMVSVHCAALSDSLLESELFGHEKGAFTGAHKTRVGRFEMANGGTLFLDEIGDISLETQVKLLRVLQERKFEPVGSSRTIEVDVRLVTATHQNLEQLIQQGKFREDLYYRLNVISLNLPPLRERREDVLELASHFLLLSSQKAGKSIVQFDSKSLEALELYGWPGNIRELQNAIERAVVLTDGDQIELRHLPLEVQAVVHNGGEPVQDAIFVHKQPSLLTNQRPFDAQANTVRSSGSSSINATTTAASKSQSSPSDERAALLQALDQSQGNKAEAARILGIPRSTFYSRLKKHSIQ